MMLSRSVSTTGSGFYTNKKNAAYHGTDDYVRAKLEGRSQGIPSIRKTNSLIRMRREAGSEEVINACGYPGRVNFFNSRKGSYVSGADMKQRYDDEEPPLLPQKDLEEGEAVQSVSSSQRALSYQKNIRMTKRYIKDNIENV